MIEFFHDDDLWADFPELVPVALHVRGVEPTVVDADAATALIQGLHARARERLATAPESELPEIKAWRRGFGRMGLKPTQYRCAAESLLRRFRKEDSLPSLHPLVDVCNAVSMAYAVPIAVLDAARVASPLKVTYACGTEQYEDLAGALEQPVTHEVVFVDAAGHAHARRWCHRQSGRSAVRDTTREVLIVAEGLHPGASTDLPRLAAELASAIPTLWNAEVAVAPLTRQNPVFRVA